MNLKGFAPLLLVIVLILGGGAYVFFGKKTEISQTTLVPPPEIPNPGARNYLPDTITEQILPSATSTTVQVANFSFTLSSVWHGEDTIDKIYNSHHVFLQKGSAVPGFNIDCPPD